VEGGAVRGAAGTWPWGRWLMGHSGPAGCTWSERDLYIFFQMKPNLFWLKSDFFKLEKFEVNYGCERFEIRNNLPFRNFSRFKMDFELKFKKASRVRI
jgi:hypothetical protein